MNYNLMSSCCVANTTWQYKVRKFLYENRYIFMTIFMMIVAGLLIQNCFADDTDLFSVGKKASSNIYSNIKDLYMHGVAYALGAICLLLYAFTNDDKKRATYKAWLITIIIVYFALWMLPVITQTVTKIMEDTGVSESTNITN